MEITLMHNPKAGNGEHDKQYLMSALKKTRHRVTYQSTKEKDYKKALKKPTDLVLVAGGDGTVTKVGRELLDTGVPMAILPLGTANNLARNLGFTQSIKKIIGGLRRGRKCAFDVGIARGPWGKRHFLEGVGSGLLADYVRKVEGDKKTKILSKEQEMTRHVSLLQRMLHDHPPRKCKIDIDDHDASGDYILWEAMNIRSIGPALYLASRAATRDGYLDFVTAREEERSLLISYLDEWLAGRRKKFPLPVSRCRKLTIISKNSGVHIDGKTWPEKKRKRKRACKIDITIRPSALIILQPAGG